jgi:hypothetical protein
LHDCFAVSGTFALCTHNVEKFLGFPPEQVSAFALGLAKTMQQGLHYCMYGQAINHLNYKVFTPCEVQILVEQGRMQGRVSWTSANSAYVGIVIILFIVIISCIVQYSG